MQIQPKSLLSYLFLQYVQLNALREAFVYKAWISSIVAIYSSALEYAYNTDGILNSSRD